MEPRAAEGTGSAQHCTQARVRTNHSHDCGTGPLFTALSQHLKPEKGEIGLI